MGADKGLIRRPACFTQLRSAKLEEAPPSTSTSPHFRSLTRPPSIISGRESCTRGCSSPSSFPFFFRFLFLASAGTSPSTAATVGETSLLCPATTIPMASTFSTPQSIDEEREGGDWIVV